MSDWNKPVATFRKQVSLRDLIDIFDTIPENLVAEFVIEILAQENKEINEPVFQWITEYLRRK